ncbi:MAG: class I SAM-dependent methyltransferase [Planctomycetaceae bacterium]
MSDGEDVTDAGERVSPDTADFGLLAHLSIYRFARRFAVGKRVLDAGCGTGYGAHDLAAGGARSVLAVDASAKAIAFCQRRYRHPRLLFAQADLMALDVAGPFDLVFCSNVLEHLADPDPFLETVRRRLAPDGVLVMAVPPIRGLGEWFGNLENPHHVTNLPPELWEMKLDRSFAALAPFAHWVAPHLLGDDGAIRRAAVDSADQFVFTPESFTRLAGSLSTISLVVVATRPRAVPRPRTTAEDGMPIAWIEARIRRDFGRLIAFKRRHTAPAA